MKDFTFKNREIKCQTKGNTVLYKKNHSYFSSVVYVFNFNSTALLPLKMLNNSFSECLVYFFNIGAKKILAPGERWITGWNRSKVYKEKIMCKHYLYKTLMYYIQLKYSKIKPPTWSGRRCANHREAAGFEDVFNLIGIIQITLGFHSFFPCHKIAFRSNCQFITEAMRTVI